MFAGDDDQIYSGDDSGSNGSGNSGGPSLSFDVHTASQDPDRLETPERTGRETKDE